VVKVKVVLEDVGVKDNDAKTQIVQRYSLTCPKAQKFVSWRIKLGKKD
jgi:hypothetical protein